MLYQHSFFEITAQKYPNAIAIDDHGKKYTYKQLEIFSNKIANFLSRHGCKANDRICILLDKGFYQYSSVLGILKSGACWVPLSETFPEERMRYLLNNIKPKIIITQKKNLKYLLNFNTEEKISFICIDSNENSQNVYSAEKIKLQNKNRLDISSITCPSDLAYIIFTSGSTGNPKGVMVTHQNTTSFLKEISSHFKPKPNLRYAHFSDLTFDPSIFDLFVCWMNKGTIVPFNKKNYKINPYAFFEANKNINVLFCVPSLILLLEKSKKIQSKSLSKINHLLLTGEAIPDGLVSSWYKTHKKSNVYNLYGTTETAIISHWFKIPNNIKTDEKIPVGKKLSNLQVFLVNDGKIVNKKGKVGESYVYGPQVSIGYWNNSFLTNKQFVNFKINNLHNQIVYKTGDLLKLENNNLFYYVGRADSQIKIRGHRVELGEIQNCIKELEEVYDAVILINDQIKFQEKIYAFIIQTKVDLTKKKIINYLEKKLPNYMMPNEIYFIKNNFPRNENGKIDKKALLNLIDKQ